MTEKEFRQKLREGWVWIKENPYAEIDRKMNEHLRKLFFSTKNNKTKGNTMENNTKTYAIAEVCHEANRVFCRQQGDNSQKPWDDAEEWQRASAWNGVEFRLNNPNASHSAQHEAWMKEKIEQGWVYGPEKDIAKKIHPCIVPYSELPVFQQKKDALFQAIVDALK